MRTNKRLNELILDWVTNPCWKGVERPYTAGTSSTVAMEDSSEVAQF